MDDLISRAAAIDAIVSATVFPDVDYIKNLCQNPANSEDWLGGVCDAINAVEEVAAVDAVQVVQGRWVFHDDDMMPWVSCSECGVSTDSMNKTPYCPYCAAKMDGRESE